MKHIPVVLLLLAACLTPSGLATDITVTTTVDEVNGNTTSIDSLKNSPGGAGISLSIGTQIVEGHGGRVGADSADGVTRVWFSLPA